MPAGKVISDAIGPAFGPHFPKLPSKGAKGPALKAGSMELELDIFQSALVRRPTELAG
jgi:hypothetical protein